VRKRLDALHILTRCDHPRVLQFCSIAADVNIQQLMLGAVVSIELEGLSGQVVKNLIEFEVLVTVHIYHYIHG
jgi:hypothetical protein